MEVSIHGVSYLLKDKVEFYKGGFCKCIEGCNINDLVYMDPPYQGTTYGKDKRYFHQLDKKLLYNELENLNDRHVHWILSYDGHTGEKVYGEELPERLEAKKILLNAGRSSQATLAGKNSTTYESLYLSKHLHQPTNSDNKTHLPMIVQESLFA